jgi:hypothetical protein
MRTKFNIYFCIIITWVDTSAGGPLVPEDIIRPEVSVSALTWFIRYIYYWNLQFLNMQLLSKLRISSVRHKWP